MKKTKYLVLVLLIAAFVCTAVACKWKNAPATAESFYEVTGKHGCTRTQEDIEDETVRSSVKEFAFSAKGNMECGFLIANDANAAKNIFTGTYNNMENLVSGTNTKVSKTMSNYSYARIADSDTVFYIARIDDTVLYVIAAKEFDGEAESIMKELGYK